MKFENLRLAEPILRAVLAEGYTTPTPIQIKAIPHVLEGRDLLGCAQTGTGKTAAFALPILHRLSQPRPTNHRTVRPIRVLVLAPTRELAAQIDESFGAYGRHLPLRHAVIFGGVNQNPQARALQNGVDVLIATPGRLLDLMQQGLADLRHVEVLVLDEADRMLDMGFIHDIRKIVAKIPKQRQTLLFSATMPADIRELANAILHQPISVQVAPVAATADKISQSVYFVEKRDKPAMLEYFLNANAVKRALVFTRTKHGADRVARHLARAGIRAEAIHGNKSQNARVRAMASFKSGAPPVLVATDIAARGIDVDDISHVINYDVPNIPETYVHRIGRTGRAGASGLAVSFCDVEERSFLRDIEKLIRQPIPVSPDKPKLPPPPHTPAPRQHHPRQATGSNHQHRRERIGASHGSARDAAPVGHDRHPHKTTTSTDHPHARPARVGLGLQGRSKPRRGGGMRRGR